MTLTDLQRVEFQLTAAAHALKSRPLLTPHLEDLFAAEVDVGEVLVTAWMGARVPESRQYALNLVADLLSYVSDPDNGTLDACAAILGELGLFPAIDVLQRKHPNWTPSLPLSLQLDLVVHGIENRLDDDLREILTDFQADLLRIAASGKDASISAPTSAGKSFALARIARKLLASKSHRIVYVVPTRALIREVSARIRRDLREHALHVPVTTAPQPKPQAASVVYVLTQERLLALIHNTERQTVDLDLVIIDEAHEVGQGDRGIILEDAIQEARLLQSRPRLLFVAPDISNPAYLLDSPRLGAQGAETRAESFSPIAHRYWALDPESVPDPDDKRRKQYRLRVRLRDESKQTVGVFRLDKRLPGAKTRALAEVALHVHSPGSKTLLYLDKKDYAEKAARHLAAQIPINTDIPKVIQDLIDFIAKHVHPRHELVDWLGRGIAIHYRTLPKTVRQRIEELAAAGEIRFVACTSTLLHGVNLPCNDIVLFEPRRGTSHLSISEFRNLVGRAGRMDHSLEGNVWLIDPANWTTDAHLPHPSQPVQSALENELEGGGQAIRELLSSSMLTNDGQQKLAAAALGRTFQLVLRGHEMTEYVANAKAQQTITALVKDLQDIQKSIVVPHDLLRRHSTFDPRSVNELYLLLGGASVDELQQWLPTRHDIDGRLFDYLEWTLGRLSKLFGPKLSDNPIGASRQVRYRAYLAYRWLSSPTFRVFLEKHIEHEAVTEQQQNDPVFVTEQTRKAIGALEDDVRFTMVQQYRLLRDMLLVILKDRGEIPPVSLAPIDLYLDFGTTDDRLLSIIGLGFSRETAGYVKRGLEKAGLDWGDVEDVIDHLATVSSEILKAWGMPPESWQEICLVVGRDEGEVVW